MSSQSPPPLSAVDDIDASPGIGSNAAIQSRGVLLCLSEPDLCIHQVSENLETALGIPLASALEGPVERVTGSAGREVLERALATHSIDGHPLYIGTLQTPHGHALDAVVHRHKGTLILELEPAVHAADGAFASMYPLVRTFVASLQAVNTVDALTDVAAREVRRLTDFGRVTIYRIDSDGSLQALAEARDAAYDTLAGTHLRGAGMTPELRSLYSHNPLRLVADVDDTPVGLVPPLHPSSGRATDLAYAALRAASEAQRETMRGMGARASLTLALTVRGDLWGLIVCHHATPCSLSFEVRAACEHLAQILSLQIEAKEDRAEIAHRLELRRILVRLLAAMADRDHFHEGLLEHPADLLGFASASGAAIVRQGECVRIGAAPDEASILRLTEWLAKERPGEVFHTDRLASTYPDGAALLPQASGVLAVQVSQLHRHYVLWFRPETPQTVRWAGDAPDAAVDHDSRNMLGRTRHWQQHIAHTSRPWRTSEVETAAEFRYAVLNIVLRRAEEAAELTSELRRANHELEAFSYSVSHDLRAPLRHIAGYAELLDEMEGQHVSERGRHFLQTISESSRFAGKLVDDLLTFSQMGRGALHLTDVDLAQLVRGVVRDLTVDQGRRHIEWNIAALPVVRADPAFLQLAMRNLLSNAVKYTRDRDPARIHIDAEQTDTETIVRIADNGVGFSMEYVAKLFGVFQRLHRMDEFEGTGIGLANVRRIIDRHGGRTWAEGELDRGATFYFALPRSPDPLAASGAGLRSPATRDA
ncbi:ATP-binding protein [Ralstonia flatus]|uniref:histidine kinase n=1 Tax=Ralstonia flatus TaxID=3058601 RepID=A0AAD2C1M9_9RALS|nr:ATP-binding protein [Ralstonia sp. LMG 32965]MBN6209373.1 GAF domain-containing protein [Ralstonia pickettii]CAJ0880954.1 Phytochrome-like protein cph1 [Ralstonia sp. LMG 32965]CAJ0894216.1 Phytochrome-like protein cph1 [Ralstonia sp. LMG 32965]